MNDNLILALILAKILASESLKQSFLIKSLNQKEKK